MRKLISHWLLVVAVVVQPLLAAAAMSGIGALEKPAVVATGDVVGAQLPDRQIGTDEHPCGHGAATENPAAGMLHGCCENAQSAACMLACSAAPARANSSIDDTRVTGDLPDYLPPHVAPVHNIHSSPYRPPRQS